jgi:Acyl-CoA synthetases (AMP-forming)/AMP-acid ligases II
VPTALTPGSPAGPEFEGWLAAQVPWAQPPSPPRFGVLYSSGTTGRPKGIVREVPSAKAFEAYQRLVCVALGMAPGRSTIVTGPLHHAAPGGQAAAAMALRLDMTIMPRFDPEEFLRLVSTRRIGHAQLVPTMFVRLLALPEDARRGYDLTSLRCAVHAAAPCPVHVEQRMIDWWGPVLREYYGGTETGPVVACSSKEWLGRPGTVGRPSTCATGRRTSSSAAG